MIGFSDQFMLALCMYREARGDGRAGMVAVGCVVRNRAVKNGTSFYAEVIKPLQFSSITAAGDPQLATYGPESAASWQLAQLLAADIADDSIQDTTGGATLYWNPNGIKSAATFTTLAGAVVPFPEGWNPAVVSETVQVGEQIFLKET
jgi:N-acetylmuramoyl-L-alanine amidase